MENLSRTGFFRDVSFHVRAGEIVGLTGLVGAGRTEVVQTIFGVEHYDAGKVFLWTGRRSIFAGRRTRCASESAC